MNAFPTQLEGCYIIEPTVLQDDRGYFYESYNQSEFEKQTGLKINFVQDNQAFSTYGVVRGLHLQRGVFSQAKLVRCLQGAIRDVAVDVRKDSTTYGEYVFADLTSENHQQLLVPHGFAHGYAVLSATAVVAYKCDGFYNKSAEDGIYLFDNQLNIPWGIEQHEAILSEKDRFQLPFSSFEPIGL